jgi:hypothetical protein
MTKRFRTGVWMGMLMAAALPGGCPMPPPAGNDNGANVNTNAPNENQNAPANENANVGEPNSNANESGSNMNANDGGNANQNAPGGGLGNENAGGNQNSNNANENAGGNDNSNNANENGGGPPTELSDEEQAAVQQFGHAVRHALVAPASLQGLAQPVSLNFDAATSWAQLNFVPGCPTVAWAHNLVSGIARIGLVFEGELVGSPCISPSLASLEVDGEIEIISFATQTGIGELSTAQGVTVNGVGLTAAGSVLVQGGGANPVHITGTISFSYEPYMLLGEMAIEASRAGVVTVSGEGLTLSDGSANFAVDAAGVTLQPLLNGSFVPVGGSVTIHRGAEPAIQVEFLSTTPVDGIARVREGGNSPIELLVFQ